VDSPARQLSGLKKVKYLLAARCTTARPRSRKPAPCAVNSNVSKSTVAYLRFDHATVIEFDNVEGADLDVFDHALRGQIPAMRVVYKWKRRPISKGASVTLRSTLD
jgi:hypothetical protein